MQARLHARGTLVRLAKLVLFELICMFEELSVPLPNGIMVQIFSSLFYTLCNKLEILECLALPPPAAMLTSLV